MKSMKNCFIYMNVYFSENVLQTPLPPPPSNHPCSLPIPPPTPPTPSPKVIENSSMGKLGSQKVKNLKGHTVVGETTSKFEFPDGKGQVLRKLPSTTELGKEGMVCTSAHN